MQSNLEEEVDMKLPAECDDDSGHTVKPNKSLFGLKHASRTWSAKMVKDLRVFRLMHDGEVNILLVIHVDGILVVCNKEDYNMINWLQI